MRPKHLIGRLPLLLFAVTALGMSSTAFAQLEEVVVTAQRRGQNLVDVPISITAFSGAQIEAQNIGQAKNYLQFTPNVSFTEDGETGHRSIGISMRGVSDFANTFTGIGGLSNSFGIYLDEFNIANSATHTANPQLQDLERIEVLRGPQGTYFGRNATGGALNLTSSQPDDTSHYALGFGYSRFDTRTFDGVVNIPITDTFCARAVGAYERSGGFLTNASPTGSDDASTHSNVRVAFRWLPTKRVTADLSLTRSEENGGTDSSVNTGVLDSDTPQSTPSILQADPRTKDVFAAFADVVPIAPDSAGFYPNNRRDIAKDFHEDNRNQQDIVNLRLNYAGDEWSLRSITGFLDSEMHRVFDNDLTQYSLYETSTGAHAQTFSEELRFFLQSDRWNVTVGGLYARDSYDTYDMTSIGSLGFYFIDPAELRPDGTVPEEALANCGFCLAPGDMIAGPIQKQFEDDSWALFGEVDWQLSETVALTTGLRYTEDAITVTEADFVTVPVDQQPLESVFKEFDNLGPDDPRVIGYRRGKSTTDGLTPRVVLSWTPRDNLHAYASATRGYKPGGLTFQQTGEQHLEVPFGRESLWNYEIGAKWRAADDRAEVSVAGFQMDWDGLQIPTADVSIVDNVIVSNFRIFNSKAASHGLELEAQGLPRDGFRIGGGIGYLKTAFKSFGAAQPFIFENVGFDLDGKTLPRSPKWTLNAFGQYDFDVGSRAAWIRLEWAHRSESRSDIEAVVSGLHPLDNELTQRLGLGQDFSSNGYVIDLPRQDFPLKVPGYGVVNLRGGIRGERWSLTGYVENLFDKNYYTGTQENFGLGGFRVQPHFRTLGVDVRIFTPMNRASIH